MQEKVYNVLFLCTGNSARSIMAEALVTTMGKGRFKGFSAGSQPGGTVNPFAIEQVAHTGYPTDALRSKSWDEFGMPDAPHMDFIFTVCDNAAGETCPYWPGHPMSAHWGFEDPAAVVGSDEEKRVAFNRIFRQIMARMNIFVSLPLHMLEKNAIEREIHAIGETSV
ncbi:MULTISPECIES: arsenate reductase ArsC [unclassified Duganella]|jgi:arsenate reductase|uniref:arsenate reductase ArsC n=1 Tax=unclassified Duganella TaxID=2636909 RepID=UPI00088AB799|nr:MULTISPECIES: arsenate reductase ArsC [unclassified Duganella]SDG82087.1 protein tyrosine phosphatase [Duganella sp. OV458]SDK09507.1 arsenate reductase [Duganella sp. OV510]